MRPALEEDTKRSGRRWITAVTLVLVILTGCGPAATVPTATPAPVPPPRESTEEPLVTATPTAVPVPPTRAAMSPSSADAPTLAAISVDTADQVERLRTLSGHREKVYALEFSGDSTYLASSSADKEIRSWDVGPGQLVYTSTLPAAVRNDIAFSPVGYLFASADTMWEVQSWQVVHTFEGGIGAVAFSPNGSTLAIAPAGQPIMLRDAASGQVVRTFDDPAENLFRCLAFSPDGTLLAAGSNNNIVRLWDVAGGGLAHTIQHDTGGQPLDHLLDLAFSPNGRVLASSGTDLMVRLWEVGSWEVIHEFSTGDAPTGLAFSPDGTILASSGRKLKLWEVERGRLLHTLPHGNVIDVAFSPDSTLLASGGYDYQIYLWGVPR